MKDSYSILGLDKGASRDQIEEAYARLRTRYKEDRFLEGYEGNEAARKLTELDEAYADIISEMTRSSAQDSYGSSLGDVDRMIREGQYDSAQSVLDSISERGGEWHYLQSIIYYKRNWYLESKKQLQLAIAADPNNEKYRSALSRLESVMAAPIDPEAQQRRAFDNNPEMGSGDNTCGACCASLCLADCCCRMLTCCS